MADIPTSYPQQQPDWTICSSLSSLREKLEFDNQDFFTFMKNLTIIKQLIVIVGNFCVRHYIPVPPELIALDPDFANLVISKYETVYASPEDNMKLLKGVALNFEQEWRNRWNLQLKDFENRYIELSKQGCQCDFDVKRKSFEQQMDRLKLVLLKETLFLYSSSSSSKDDDNSSEADKTVCAHPSSSTSVLFQGEAQLSPQPLEQVLRRSATSAIPKCNLPLANGFSQKWEKANYPQLCHRVLSAHSSDADYLNALYVTVVPSKSSQPPRPLLQPKIIRPLSDSALRKNVNIPKDESSESRLILLEREESFPSLLPNSPYLCLKSQNHAVSVNAY
ncbi:hypothetical protein Aperf_G00000066135 [Anoplocephala perfoliata]